jgi:hypothetical protein
VDERDWAELLRMLHGMGLRIISTDRATSTICVQVPEIRETTDDVIREWSS